MVGLKRDGCAVSDGYCSQLFVDKFGCSGPWSRPLWLLGVVCGGLRSLEGRRDDGDVEVFV
jgi:hypothetical protein